MPTGNAPQYRGIDAVIEAYENANIPAFAVCYAKDINVKYAGDSIEEGSELLKFWLEKVKGFGSEAIYQLRLYENVDKGIRSNTAYDMAFKFVLNDRDKSLLPARSDSAVSNAELIAILKENAELKAENAVLSLKVDQYEEEDEDENEADKVAKAEIKKPLPEQLLEQFAPALGMIGQRIVDLLLPPSIPQVAKVSGIVIETGNIDEEKIIEQSLRRLREKIPDNPGLGPLLMKLADMCERSPAEFNFYMSMLMKRTF